MEKLNETSETSETPKNTNIVKTSSIRGIDRINGDLLSVIFSYCFFDVEVKNIIKLRQLNKAWRNKIDCKYW